ncbi:MAG: carbohydrate kinase family protein [Candidatus Magasanikbacteria bacterium]|nr:carbohydrate kinase family protein [Candidatus Magasanikbacteria bacterium]
MYNLIGIGDPIIDTHVQIDETCTEAKCHLSEKNDEMKLCFDYGSKIPIVDSFQSLGGNAPNVLVGATRLGLTTALISTVGGDANGAMAIEALKKEKVNTDFITEDTKNKTRYSIILNYKKERTILSYSNEKKYRWPSSVPPADWVYYTGMSAGFETVQEKLHSYLDKHPSTSLAINPGSYMLKYALLALREAISWATLLIVNLEEAEKILGSTLEKEKSVRTIIRELCSLGPKEVALTDGSHGAWAGTAEEVWHLDAYPVEVVSKTGAGDAFSSGFLTARFHGHDIAHALEWGIANSSGVVQNHGSQAGLCNQKELKEMMQKFKKIRPTLVS